jgi:hypothetical protein
MTKLFAFVEAIQEEVHRGEETKLMFNVTIANKDYQVLVNIAKGIFWGFNLKICYYLNH